jgi:cephalosporin-C deacetylase-like acetyl esterase
MILFRVTRRCRHLQVRRIWLWAALQLVAVPVVAQPLVFTPLEASGIYQRGARAGWTVSLPPGTAPTQTYTYSVKRNNADEIAGGSLDLSKGAATIAVVVNDPAMLRVTVAGSSDAAPTALGAAVAPAKLQPAVPRPRDFDAFWNAKLAALHRVPMAPRLIEMQTDVPGVRLYRVTLDSLGSHVQGYLAVPARAGRFPALMLYQYAGVYALQTRTVTDRAAAGWLAFNVSSHDMAPDQATGVPANYQAIGNTDRESSYFLNMYLRDVRAVDYITTRADWNGKTIVATGTSMGGQQSLATAALQPKITAVIANEPSGADSNGDLHGRRAGYPNWPSTDATVMKTALYFDTVNLASRIKVPTIVAIGFLDTIAPPAGIWTALNQVRGPHEAVPMIDAEHNNITPDRLGAWERRSREALDELLSTNHLHVRK